jgi:glyoxylate carboligase
MITSVEFDAALKLIADYKIQMDKELKASVLHVNQKIDIQDGINEKIFIALQNYYQLDYAMQLKWEDLKAMDICLLESIDYDKMALTKGFGMKSLFVFKKLMVSHSIINQEELYDRNKY